MESRQASAAPPLPVPSAMRWLNRGVVSTPGFRRGPSPCAPRGTVELFNDIRIGFDVAKVGDLVSLDHRVGGFLAHVEAAGDRGRVIVVVLLGVVGN